MGSVARTALKMLTTRQMKVIIMSIFDNNWKISRVEIMKMIKKDHSIEKTIELHYSRINDSYRSTGIRKRRTAVLASSCGHGQDRWIGTSLLHMGTARGDLDFLTNSLSIPYEVGQR